MKKILAVAIMFAMSSIAFAACDLTYTTKVDYKGDPDWRGEHTWFGLEPAEVAAINAKGEKIVDMASKLQDQKDGDYGVDFLRKVTCAGSPPKDEEGVRVQGLTWKEIAKLERFSNKVELEILQMGDDHTAKGSKRAWKKDKHGK